MFKEGNPSCDVPISEWKGQDIVNFQEELMDKVGGRLSEDDVFAFAEELGLDMDLLFLDMNHPSTNERITANMTLARDLGIDGTPSFVVGNKVIAGAVGYDALAMAIAQAREDAGENAGAEPSPDSEHSQPETAATY